MAGPRESIVELRGWIDQIQKDADALAARKHLFQQPSKPPRPTSNPWGDEPSSFRLVEAPEPSSFRLELPEPSLSLADDSPCLAEGEATFSIQGSGIGDPTD